MGQRMAFEAVQQSCPSAIMTDILEAFESISIAEDASWYMENMALSGQDIYKRETNAYEKLLPHLSELLARTGAKDFVTSPLVSETEWEDTIRHFPKFSQAQAQEQSTARL